MIRNYRVGDFESLDMTITDAGTSQIKLRYDVLEGNAIADLELYSDSGRTTPLSASDWEYYTTDTNKTNAEAGTGGSGKTVYKEIRILNPTYQTGPIYATFNNFGTYPDGSVLGIDYITIDDDYTYTTQRNLMTYLVCDGLSVDITITVTDGGFDERSRFKVVNKDSTYKVIVQDDTDLKPYWVMPSQSVDFYDVGTTLVWASGGWELRYINWANTATLPPSSILRPSDLVGLYEVVYGNSTTFGNGIVSPLRIQDSSQQAEGPNFSTSSTIRPTWNPAGPYFYTQNSTYDIKELRSWHDPA
jgi:hypothetical protein